MFIWDEKPAGNRKTGDRRREMYKREIEDRASLLLRLGYSAKDVKARLQKSVDWDFDMHDSPDHAADVGKIVDEIYKRNQK